MYIETFNLFNFYTDDIHLTPTFHTIIMTFLRNLCTIFIISLKKFPIF